MYQKDPDTGKPKNRLELVRDYLKVDPSIKLRISETGLTYSEFKAIYMLQKNKYSSYTSEQLTVLANKILYRLQLQCEEHANQWLEKANEIAKEVIRGNWGNADDRRKRLTEAGYDAAEVQRYVNTLMQKESWSLKTLVMPKSILQRSPMSSEKRLKKRHRK